MSNTNIYRTHNLQLRGQSLKSLLSCKLSQDYNIRHLPERDQIKTDYQTLELKAVDVRQTARGRHALPPKLTSKPYVKNMAPLKITRCRRRSH